MVNIFNSSHFPMFCGYVVPRISLKKMPSIRETLQEIGVTPEEVYAQLIQKSGDSPSNGTAPTPLTNYLDVRNLGTLTDT